VKARHAVIGDRCGSWWPTTTGTLQTTLAAILEDEGHKVRALYEAAEVMSTVRRFEPDAVILDIAMPGMSGYDIDGRVAFASARVRSSPDEARSSGRDPESARAARQIARQPLKELFGC
jgi:hypothetical protein